MGKHAVKSEVRSPKSEVRRAVFLDRDGVINRALERDGKPYPPRAWTNLKFFPKFPPRAQNSKQAGFLLVVVTNQPDVGRGTLKKEIVETIHAEMCRQLPIDRVEVCYHPGKGAVRLRLPQAQAGHVAARGDANWALTSRKAGWSATAGGTLIAATPPAAGRFSLIAVTRRSCGKNRIFPLAIWLEAADIILRESKNH